MVFGLLSPYNGNPLFLQTTRPLHNYPSHVLCTYYRQSRTLTGKISTLPNSLVVTSLDFYGEPTALFYDLGLGHLRMLGARIISNDGPRLSNFYAADWTATSAKGILEQQIQFISWKWIEEPAKLTEEIALNPKPDLDAVPVEVEQGIMDVMIKQYGDWKKADEEEVRRGREAGKERGWVKLFWKFEHQGSNQRDRRLMGLSNLSLPGSPQFNLDQSLYYIKAPNWYYTYDLLRCRSFSVCSYSLQLWLCFFVIPSLVRMPLGKVSRVFSNSTQELDKVSPPCSKLLARHLALWLDCVLEVLGNQADAVIWLKFQEPSEIFL